MMTTHVRRPAGTRRRQSRSAAALLLLPLVALLLLAPAAAATGAEIDDDEEAAMSPAAYSAALAEAVAAVLPSASASAPAPFSPAGTATAAAFGAPSSAAAALDDPIAAELAWEAVELKRFLHKQKEEEEEEEEEEEREKEREREEKKRETSLFSSPASFSSSSSSPRPSEKEKDKDPWTSPFEKPLADLDAEEAADRAAERERELVDRMIEEAAEAKKRAAAAAGAEGTATATASPGGDSASSSSSSAAAAPSAALSATATRGAPAGEPPPPTAKDAKKKNPPPSNEADDDDEEPPPYNPSFPSPVGVGVPRSGGALLLADGQLALSPYAAVAGAKSGATENFGNTRPLLSLSAALPSLYDPTFGGRGLPAPRPGVPRPPALLQPPLLNSFAAKAEYAAYLRAGFRDDMQAAENERPKPRKESSSDGTLASNLFPPSPLAAVASSTKANEFGARTDDIPVVAATRLDLLPSAVANKAKDGLEASRTVVANGTAPVGLSFAANAAVDQPSRRFRPPDQSLCVGNGVVITGNNLVLRTWDAETGAPLQGPIAQPEFFGLSGNFSDPGCIYDAQDTKRFFVSVFRFNEVQPGKYSQFVVAVSKTSDPADGFLGPYVIRNDGLDPLKGEKPLPGLERCGGGFSKKANQTAEAGCLGDYPSVGLDAHSLWVGFNLFRTAPLDGYAGSLVVALSKKDLVSGEHLNPAAAYYSNFDQTLAYTVQPTQTQPGTPHETSRGGTVYLVSTAPVVQSEPNVPALAAWAATQTSLLSEEDFPRVTTAAAEPAVNAAAEKETTSTSDFSFAAAAAAAASSSSSSSPVDPFPGIPRISNAAVVPTPAYRDPGAFKKQKLAVQQPSPGWGLDGGDARTLQHVLSGGLAWTAAQTVMRVGGPQAPLSIGAVYFALLPEWETRRKKKKGAEAVVAGPGAKSQQKQEQQGLLADKEEEDQGPAGDGDGESEEVYVPKLVAAGYIAPPGGRSIARPAIVATRSGTAYVAGYMSGADFAMSPVVAEVDLFNGPSRVMVPALSPVPLEPSNADRLFKAGDPKGGGTLRVGDYSAAVLGDDLRTAWLASEWSGGVPSPACVEQQGPTKCPSWSTYVSRVDLPAGEEGNGASPTAAERVRAARKVGGGAGAGGAGSGGVEVGKKNVAGGLGKTGGGGGSGPSSSSSTSFPLPKVGGALGGPVAGGDKALAALAAEAKNNNKASAVSSSSGQQKAR